MRRARPVAGLRRHLVRPLLAVAVCVTIGWAVYRFADGSDGVTQVVICLGIVPGSLALLGVVALGGGVRVGVQIGLLAGAVGIASFVVAVAVWLVRRSPEVFQ